MIQALLVEIDSNKVDCFAKFLAYIERYMAIHLLHYASLKLSPNRSFEAIYFCSASYQRACTQVRPVLAVDRIYTRSKYCIQLLIAIGINTNNNGISIA